jgi:hypothetical protein
MMAVPEKAEGDASAFRIGFRHFQRVEGVFRVNAKARVQSIQARVYETGVEAPRATQSVTPGAG